MFDRLEEAQRMVKLFAVLGVLHCGLKLPFARPAQVRAHEYEEPRPCALEDFFTVGTDHVLRRKPNVRKPKRALVPSQVMDMILLQGKAFGLGSQRE